MNLWSFSTHFLTFQLFDRFQFVFFKFQPFLSLFRPTQHPSNRLPPNETIYGGFLKKFRFRRTPRRLFLQKIESKILLPKSSFHRRLRIRTAKWIATLQNVSHLNLSKKWELGGGRVHTIMNLQKVKNQILWKKYIHFFLTLSSKCV